MGSHLGIKIARLDPVYGCGRPDLELRRLGCRGHELSSGPSRCMRVWSDDLGKVGRSILGPETRLDCWSGILQECERGG